MSVLIFKIAFILLWIFYIIIRAPFETIYKREEKVKTINSRKENFLLFLLFLGLLLVPLVWIFTSLLDMFDINLPVWSRLLGIVIAILSLFYFKWIHKTLGANWSPTLEIRKGHQLINSGPYQKIRHPMYAQIWIWTIAQFLIISNIFSGLSGILSFAILYYFRVPQEEKMMIDKFGDKYIQYIKQTGRVIPKFFKP